MVAASDSAMNLHSPFIGKGNLKDMSIIMA
jgi:hypothetical protein